MAAETTELQLHHQTAVPYFDLLVKHMDEMSRVGTRSLPKLKPGVRTSLSLIAAVAPEINQSYAESVLSQTAREEERQQELRVIDKWIDITLTNYPLQDDLTLKDITATRIDLENRSITNPDLIPAHQRLLAIEAICTKSHILACKDRQRRNEYKSLAVLGAALTTLVAGVAAMVSQIPEGIFVMGGGLVMGVGSFHFVDSADASRKEYSQLNKHYKEISEKLRETVNSHQQKQHVIAESS